MNYQPNYLAIGLKSGRSNTIGVLVSDISISFFAKLASYVQHEMEKYGYAVIIMNTDEDKARLERMLYLLESRQMDGYVVVPTDNSEGILRDFISRNPRPFVLLDRTYPDLELASVTIDNYKMAYLSTQSLINRHCKRLVMFTYDNDLSNLKERQRGFESAVGQAGIANHCVIKTVTYKNLKTEVSQFIQENLSTNQFDGMFFATNTIAFEAIKTLRYLNKEVGKDIYIASFDKNEAFDLMESFIPYVEQPLEEMGKTVAQLLHSQLEEHVRSSFRVELPARFVDSCKLEKETK